MLDGERRVAAVDAAERGQVALDDLREHGILSNFSSYYVQGRALYINYFLIAFPTYTVNAREICVSMEI